MSQYDFDKLVEKYLAGESSPEEEKLMHEWAELMLEQSRMSLSETDKQVIHKRLWERIYSNTIRQQPFLVRHDWFRPSAVAASVLLLLVAGISLWKLPKENKRFLAMTQKKQELPGTVNIRNTSVKEQTITLKDGSTVVLSARSTLSYPERFGDKKREVYLQGEGFFDVKKDSAHPFIVHTGNLVTQVLGTSFMVKSYDEDSAIEVQVTRGRVSVYEASEKSSVNRNGVILIPNQKITFDKTSQKLTPGLVETPRIIQPPDTRTSFVFDRTPLAQVLATLRKAYGIEFVVENQALNHCAFNGDLNDLPLYLQLDLVCKSLNATYERRGTTLFINGEGCSD
ncbi:hypothetical protein GCM10028808_32790 [Spirosoma migulaei]